MIFFYAAVPAEESLPKPSKIVLDAVATFPYFVFTASIAVFKLCEPLSGSSIIRKSKRFPIKSYTCPNAVLALVACVPPTRANSNSSILLTFIAEIIDSFMPSNVRTKESNSSVLAPLSPVDVTGKTLLMSNCYISPLAETGFI